MHYLPFYGLIFALLIEIFMACLYGNFVELTVWTMIHFQIIALFENKISYLIYKFLFQFDRIYASALNLKWNEMSMRDQHLYKFFIHRCQNPALLTVGGFVPLNLDTCVKVKTIYLFFSEYIENSVHFF